MAMTAKSLRSFREAFPFRPITLHLADGRAVRVPRPESLAVSGTGRTAVVVGEDDGFEVVDLDRVASLSFGPAIGP